MIRALAIFSCLLGLFVALLVLEATPHSGDVEAKETGLGPDGCSTREVALDEGYGITRKVSQLVCAEKN